MRNRRVLRITPGFLLRRRHVASLDTSLVSTWVSSLNNWSVIILHCREKDSGVLTVLLNQISAYKTDFHSNGSYQTLIWYNHCHAHSLLLMSLQHSSLPWLIYSWMRNVLRLLGNSLEGTASCSCMYLRQSTNSQSVGYG